VCARAASRAVWGNRSKRTESMAAD
jgi:hypothetical protein